MRIETTIKYDILNKNHNHYYGDEAKCSRAIYFAVVSECNRKSNV